jgi:IS605 OrfB family transposase
MRITIPGTLHQGNQDALKQLMRDWSSCVRYAYQRIHKEDLTGNAIKVACKPIYMKKLNGRYIADAVFKAQTLKKDHVIFGGKKRWRSLLSGLLPKKEWQESRDSELYSRGERAKKGNLNIRVLNTPDGYKLRVGFPGPREFFLFNLYIPEGRKNHKKNYKELLDLYGDCYDVRINDKFGKFKVSIGLDVPDVKPIYLCSNGVLGLDINPDGIAVVEVGSDGNLIKHEYLNSERLQFARHAKRKNDIEALALQVVNKAILCNKGVVVEDFKFNKGKKGSRKFNRMRHNFIYSQLLLAIERRAVRAGVEIRKINPAFTSITGILKYQEQYSLNRHTAAALVIGRRGMGIMEKVKVKVEPGENKKLNLAGRGFKIALTVKAYAYFRHLYRVVEMKTPAVTPPCLTPLIGNYGTG